MALHPVTLDVQTLLTMIRWRHGEPHPVLAHEPAWYDAAALRALDEAASDELNRQGLSTGGRLTPEFDDVVGALFHPDREFYGWVNTTIAGQPHSCGVLAGVAHQQGFLLVREYQADRAGTVTLWAVDPDEVLDRFLTRIPPARPADRRPVSAVYDTMPAPPAEKALSTGFRTTTRLDADAVQELLAQPRLGAGSLYTAIRGRGGARVRSRQPVNYIDTVEGRWVFTLKRSGGRRWVTALPATRELIAARLSETLRSLEEHSVSVIQQPALPEDG
ncbi:hypothetical protein ALI22I_05320 [Saccharothrix sp. ALI-22-I]|uniref:ESX secretion-associated protein EspG n=1 Tax=Saccharothrix sp. ALI-22-I TaxID=1933778 RepID=UPI00097C493C|nr:ESX secretion-associated protein EspG [Saccharothrix sp. ALI-22-I]ONI92208.1 hypothetical protein ALI22I_05320 [Saccharothrix sp. ALI-22-I]